MMKQNNDNSPLDFGYGSAEQTKELKQLWWRMVRWKLPVAIVGTFVSLVGMVVMVLATMDTANSLEYSKEIFGEDSRYYQSRIAELRVFIALLFFVICLLVFFIWLFVLRSNADKYLTGQSFEKTIASQTNFWRALSIGIILSTAGVITTVVYTIYIYSSPDRETITQPAFGIDNAIEAVDAPEAIQDSFLIAPSPTEDN